jgi:hypothetical protein
MPSSLYLFSTNHERSGLGFLGLIWAMIKVMVGSAGASPKRIPSPERASVTEPTHIPAHRRFNRSSAAYDAAIDSELRRQQQSVESATEPVLGPTRVPAKKNRLLVPLLFLAVLLVAASVTFALAYLRDHHLTPADAAALVQGSPAQNARLGMRARQQGEDLLVSWDGKSQAVQSATDGLLQVDDGAQHREIALDRAGIASCSMLYRPTSDDVVFRLEVRGKGGLHGAESLEVVGARPRTPELESSRTPAAVPEVTSEPRPKAENSSPTALASNRRGAKKVNAARPASQPASRRASKAVEASGRAFRPSSQALAAEKAPSLSMAAVTAAQPSPLSGQQLPKPPPQTSNTAAKSANHAAETAGSPAEPSSPLRGSTSTNGMS